MHSSNGRDIGIMAQGDFLKNANGQNLLHYAVSVVNGQGINLKDVDQRKNVVASFWGMLLTDLPSVPNTFILLAKPLPRL